MRARCCVRGIVAAMEDETGMLFILAAATGRAGELLGLEIRHFDRHSIKVEQSVWRSDAQAPKTQNAYRIVDLPSDVAKLLSGFVGDRESGYIFCTSNGKATRSEQHPCCHASCFPAAHFARGLSKQSGASDKSVGLHW